jgi:hypothetical protein
MLAEVVAATVPLDAKQAAEGNPLRPLLDSISLFGPERGTSGPRKPVEPERGSWTPDQPGEALKRVERGAPGSYERFVGSFGRVMDRR